MKIIDFYLYGNIIKLYLGTDDLKDWWGDDWDDAPYEHNAGTVYSEYVSETVQVALPLQYTLWEPCRFPWVGINSPYSKQDMINRKIPFLHVIRYVDSDVDRVSCAELYFGDNYDSTLSCLTSLGGVLLHNPPEINQGENV